MSSPSEKSISVVIAGKSFPIKIKAEEEANLTAVVADIDKAIKALKSQYPALPKEDILSMALLQYAVDMDELKRNTPDREQVIKEIDRIEQMISSLLA